MKQIGLAVLNFESAHKLLPPAAKAPTRPPTRRCSPSSRCLRTCCRTWKNRTIYNQIDLRSYRDITARTPSAPHAAPSGDVQGNVAAALTNIPTYVCPSNPFSAQNLRDQAGFGGTDYFATVYTDIGTNGVRNRTTRMEGALTVVGGTDTSGSSTDPSGYVDSTIPTSVPISAIADGTSNTICVIEDAGRMAPSTNTTVTQVYYTLSGYPDTFTGTMLSNDYTDVGGKQRSAASGAGQILTPAAAVFPDRPTAVHRMGAVPFR